MKIILLLGMLSIMGYQNSEKTYKVADISSNMFKNYYFIVLEDGSDVYSYILSEKDNKAIDGQKYVKIKKCMKLKLSLTKENKVNILKSRTIREKVSMIYNHQRITNGDTLQVPVYSSQAILNNYVSKSKIVK
jgi:hypothetical protein